MTDKSAGDQVMGFYPYWSSTPVNQLRFDILTVVAFFSIEIDQNGNFTNLHGWPHGALINLAHANGAKAVVTVSNFYGSQISALLGAAANRQNAINNIVNQVVSAGADGVNIDFEGVPALAKTNFVTFIAELNTALNAAINDAHLSVCTPAVDWAYAYDFDQLAANVDFLFIMAYDYHYKGGDPGPVAPLYAGSPWDNWAGIDWTLNDYQTYIAPYTLAKVVVGLPLYGYNWPTNQSTVPGTSQGTATAVMMKNALSYVQSGTYGAPLYDPQSETPYLVYASNPWRQIWFDDEDSLALRIEYAKNQNAGGIGFWALGYDDNNDNVWNTVDQYFGDGTDDDDDATDDDDDDSGPICGGSALAGSLLRSLGK
jgi:spore germination protein YaaH